MWDCSLEVLHSIWGMFLDGGLASGFSLYQLCTALRPAFGEGRFWKALLFLTLAGSSGMVIWIGDSNLLYTLPVFFALFFLATRGDWVGRLAVCVILFCLEMSVCALLDSYLQLLGGDDLYRWYDVVTRLARPLVFGGLWLALRRRLPRETGDPLSPAVEAGAGPGGHAVVRSGRRGAADLPKIRVGGG